MTVVEVIYNTSKITSDKQSMWTFFGSFLDIFYSEDNTEDSRYDMVKDEPERFENISNFNYCFIAGAIHKICGDYGVKIPEWVMKKEYFLDEPHFSLDAKGDLRLILLRESPIPFRMRNIFTSANTLDRV